MASDALERDLVQESAGFQSKAEYKQKREALESEKALLALKRIAEGSGVAPVPASTVASTGDSAVAAQPKKKKAKKVVKAGLSFGDDLEAEEGEASPSIGAMKMGKCRDLDTSFLEKNATEREEAARQQEAALREVLAQQQKAREESLVLKFTFRSTTTQKETTCGYLDGEIKVKRGMGAEEVAVAIRKDVEARGGKFAPTTVNGVHEQRDVLLCCACAGMPQGTFLIPGSVSLLELSTRRFQDTQASLFEDFAHGIVVVERRHYDAFKHIYPFSHWRPYESRDEYEWSEYLRTRGKPFQPLEPMRPPKTR